MAAPSEPGFRPLLPLPPEDELWLKRLHGELWVKRHYESARSRSCAWYERDGRKISAEEWTRVEQLVKTYGLPCVMDCGAFGFGLSIAIYNHASMPDVTPEGLLMVTNNHLQDPGDAYDQHETAWRTFSPFTHTEENERVCVFYGLEPPQERGHYDY